MKSINLTLFTSLLLFFFSCSNPHQEFIDKLEEEAANNELGVDMKYKVIDFTILDTLFNQERADSLTVVLNQSTEEFKKFDLSADVFKKYTRQELQFRLDKNYYENAVFNDSLDSPWLSELRGVLKKTDTLFLDFENANILDKMELYTWYNIRNWEFHQNSELENKFKILSDLTIQLKEIEKEISSLLQSPDEIIHYKTKVNFKQVNPLLGGAEQNLTTIKYFDQNKNLIVEI